MNNSARSAIERVAQQFIVDGDFESAQPYGTGHINDTHLVVYRAPNGAKLEFNLQRINRYVFPDPEMLMNNIDGVTDHLRSKILLEGGDENRETQTVVSTRSAHPLYIDEHGNAWRMFTFISGTHTYDLIESPELFYESGVAFGTFQRRLSDYDAERLGEVIPDFHNTPVRLEQLRTAVREDRVGRAASVAAEIEFAQARVDLANELQDLREAGEIPLRVTHNDTKLNNVLFDNETNRAICVIDLDTVMPGLAVHDFGDAIRFGAATAEEDCTDLDAMELSLEFFEAFTRGFIEGCKGGLTPREIELLPLGALTLTYELGMRFLADHINGDVYFKIHREGHNLDRARAQFKLLQSMEEKFDAMQSIVARYM